MFIYLKILYIAGVLHKKITIEGSRLTIKYIHRTSHTGLQIQDYTYRDYIYRTTHTGLHIRDFKYRTTYRKINTGLQIQD